MPVCALFEVFQQLPQATSADTFSAAKAPDLPDIWVARDAGDRPQLLIEARAEPVMPAPIVLRYLEFDPWRECTIANAGGGVRHAGASLIRCTAAEPELRDYFFRTSAAVLADLPAMASVGEIARAVDRLTELFQGFSTAPTRSLQGLWAELFLLARAENITQAATAWQPTPRSLIDFASRQHGIEVKSSSTDVRCHRFKLAQLQPGPGREWYVASLMVRHGANGTSLTELWDTVERRLLSDPTLRKRVARVIAQSVGDDWRRAGSVRCDEVEAANSLALFDTAAVPRVGDDAPPPIADIEFSVDLSSFPQVDIRRIAARNDLVRNILHPWI